MNKPPVLEINPDVVCSPLDDGGVLLDLTTKQYFALNAPGLIVWQHLEDGGSLAELGDAIASSGVNGHLGLTDFADLLVLHGLAVRTATNGLTASRVPIPALPSTWTAPRLTPHGRPLAQVILSPFDPTVPVPE